MKRVNPDDFESYTISFPGLNITLRNFGKVLREWKNINKAGSALYGNKKDGTRCILDTK